MTTILRLAASASLLAIAAPALAQQAAPQDDETIIVTAQRANQTGIEREGNLGALGNKAAEDVPFSLRSYNEALILNQQPQTLGQVLENDPSIRTTYGFGNAAELFIIRGFPLFGDDIALDGLYGIAPRQLVAPELYARVQVLNGANAFLNGAAPGGTSLGGSVNLALKRAGDAPLTRATANYTSSSHFGGSADVGRRFGADGQFGIRVNGAYRAGDVAIDNEFRRSAVVGLGADWRGERARLSLDLAYQRVVVRNLRPKVTLAPTLTAVPRVPDADANYGQAFAYTELRDLFGIVRGEYDLADNALLYAAFGARDGSEEGIYDGLTVNNAVTGDATGTALFVPRTDNNESAQAGVRVKLAAGGVSHEVNVGGSYLWQVNRNAYDFRYGPGFAGYATNLYDTPVRALPGSTLVGGNLDDPFPVARVRQGGVFASDTIGLADDRVLLTAGLRLQTIIQRSYSINDGALNPGGYDEDAVTPVVGLVVKPARGVSLYANRIEGLAPGPTAPAGTTNAGEIFAPYKTVQYEVGGKFALGALGFDGMTFGVGAYRTRQPNGIATPSAANPLLNTFAVDGRQRNQGLEFTLDGEVTRGLRLIAGASVTDATLRRTQGGVNQGNKVYGIPDYTVNANAEWDLPFIPALTLTGRVVHTGEQQVNAANTLELPTWTRVDLGARYVAVVGDRPLTLRFTVDNVANERYWASAYDSFANALLQGQPRTFKASASIDF